MSREKKIAARRNKPSMADTAELHDLYEDAVQCVESEIDFVDATFEQIRGRKALSLREDFCGTASACCEWVKRRTENTAIGVDIDADVQNWGREHRISKLEPDAALRIQLIEGDVRDTGTDKVDTLLAMNFSYWYFKTREEMIRYFEAARDHLNDDGVFFLDAFGGYEAYQEMREKTKNDGFTYVWEQAEYNPITGDYLCHIHFHFKDGSRINNAFSYEWRLWSLPEIRELLTEAGFKNPTIYWEGTDEDDEGDGVFTASEQGEADAGWIAYISAEK